MKLDEVRVVKVETLREEIDYKNEEIADALRELVPTIKKQFRLPFAKEKVTIEMTGVPTAVANALRRILAGELRGKCMTFDNEMFDREKTTDPFMVDIDYVRTRIRMIPLCTQISESIIRDLRLALDVVNKTKTTMTIYAGDLVVTEGHLSKSIFNPTHEIGFLQPGCSLVINEIYIAQGFGNANAAFMVAARAALKPLDIEEYGVKATHKKGGSMIEQSGFKQSSLVANPRHFRVSAYIRAAPLDNGAASVSVLVDACDSIMSRLKFILGILDATRAQSSTASRRVASSFFHVAKTDSGVKGVLSISNETDTIGNLLARIISESVPKIKYVGYTCIPHEKSMTLTIEHDKDPSGILLAAVKLASAVFKALQQGIRKKR